jgi:hypothetical protein
MDSNIQISNSQLVFAFQRNLGIRKKVFEYEDLLKDYFKVPFKTIAIDDEAEPSIPRFESLSKQEHSKLQVSQNRITLLTRYDQKFRLDLTEVRNYLNERFTLLKNIAQKESLQFIAYIIELGADFKKEELNPFIKENTGAYAINENCRDFQLLYSLKYKDDYYLNIRNSKFIEDEFNLDKQNNILKPTGNKRYGISVVVDINSRPYFEKNKEVDEVVFKNIENYTFNLIDNLAIKDFLKGNIEI